MEDLLISSTFNLIHPWLPVGNYLAIQKTGKFVAQEPGTYRFSFTGTLIAPNWPTNAKNFLHLKKDGTVSEEWVWQWIKGKQHWLAFLFFSLPVVFKSHIPSSPFQNIACSVVTSVNDRYGSRTVSLNSITRLNAGQTWVNWYCFHSRCMSAQFEVR